MSLIIFVVFMLIIVGSFRVSYSMAHKNIRNKYLRRFSVLMFIIILSIILYSIHFYLQTM